MHASCSQYDFMTFVASLLIHHVVTKKMKPTTPQMSDQPADTRIMAMRTHNLKSVMNKG